MIVNDIRGAQRRAGLRVWCRLAILVLLALPCPPASRAELPISQNAQVHSCRPGPWGRVDWHYIHIEAPEWIVEKYSGSAEKPRWCFPGVAAPELRTFFLDAGIAPQTIDAWFTDPQAILSGEKAITIFPSVAEVLALSGPARSAIYRELAKTPLNPHHHGPLIILDQNLDDWLGPRALRPALREAIERMTYLRGDALAFSDLPALQALARDENEALDMLKLGTRTRAVMAYLNVNDSDDLDAIESYWTAAHRHKDITPILESLTQLPGGGRIGFTHLLTAQPRKLLYTYPTPDLAADGLLPDCHWTTLNFFNYRAKNVFLDQRLAVSQLEKDYGKVSPPYTFGDALFFITADGRAIHSCTYLCDDLVFTKNGEAAIAPWTIAHMQDVVRLYAQLESASVQGFRRLPGRRR